jgi:hypothetical protein
MAVKHDAEALREFLRAHSVEGYQVTVPIFGHATIERQISTGGGFVFYRVVADQPVPFHEFADQVDASPDPMTIEEWRDKFVGGKTKSLPTMAVDLREQLEAGGKVSQRDMLFRELMDVGCLDADQNVFCHSFESRFVTLRALRKGMAVEIGDEDGNGWPGRVIGFDGTVVLIEQFAPVTLMRAPSATVWDKIKPGFYSKEVIALGHGIVDSFDEQGVALPEGAFSEDRREYELKEPMPLSEIEKFCKKHYEGKPDCAMQAMTLFILPINSKEAKFFPLPEGRDPEEYVVELES